ncbi:zinc finger CCHC domain-containing protein 10-like [Macrobrachium nipponense]|uniref:zinc finger CCHC domain-containing protein 10-like n=1 Tax=Macrobrachium nipponense TaxID=159736 RepID=UPI0030C7F89E
MNLQQQPVIALSNLSSTSGDCFETSSQPGSEELESSFFSIISFSHQHESSSSSSSSSSSPSSSSSSSSSSPQTTCDAIGRWTSFRTASSVSKDDDPWLQCDGNGRFRFNPRNFRVKFGAKIEKDARSGRLSAPQRGLNLHDAIE